ncbi:glycine zipper family protein [Thermodesulfobacteriota bacterium]
MKRVIFIFFFMLVTFVFTGMAVAQEPIIFPAKGQSQDQMEKDKFSCYQWARNETGFDPMKQPTASSPPPQQQARQGGALRGAAVGATTGAVVKRSGSRSYGARTGAVVGGVLGGARQSRKNQKDQQAMQQWEQQQAAEYAAKRNTYNRAFSACMESKGYTVK